MKRTASHFLLNARDPSYRRASFLLAATAALSLAACTGDENNNANNANNNTNNTNNNTNNTTDTTPPTVTIGDDVAGDVASGDVTFTFTFSEAIRVDFGEEDVAVTGGTPGAFTIVSDTVSTLVVAPPADSTGTIEVSVGAGAFTDLAGNANTEPASASQDFDTTSVIEPTEQMDLPVSFDDPDVIYGLLGFGGAEDSSVVTDPTDSTNKVAQVVRSAEAETFAGTTLTEDETKGFANPVPFDAENTRMTVRVWSPEAGVPVRLKIEDSMNAAVSVETEATTTMAQQWETLTFEFAQQASGTAPLDFTATYDKATIFFNFGTDGATAGEQTFYFDDMIFIGGTTGGPTGDFDEITFDDATVTYTLTGFGGAEDSTVVSDPENGGNMVAQVNRADDAETFAGTTVSTGPNNSVKAFPIDAQNTRITMRVWSPDASTAVRVKIENQNDSAVAVETESFTTTAGAWEELTFDFALQVSGTTPLDVNATYDKITVFFAFGVDGATLGAKTYYFDDIVWIGGTTGGPGGDFDTMTFDDPAVTYAFTGFGGANGMTVTDPAGGTNVVGQLIKSNTAETWAGVTISTGPANSVPRFPIDANNTRITMRVYSADAGTPVRVKIEDATDATVTVETEVSTTMANAWEELTFDFADEVTGTAAVDVNATYNKISVFFDFGTDGATAGEKTYHFDDITWIGGGGTGPGPMPGTFSVLDFEDPATVYTFTGFGGASGSRVVDPTNASNQVGQIDKPDTAELWAGVTISTGANDTVGRFPIDANNTRITVRVWSPDANTPVRVKIEDSTDPTVSVESEVQTTMASAWETVTIDFADEVTGTAALDVNATYDKMSVFFNFGTTGMAAGSKTYYLDDVTWIGGGGTGGGPTNFTTLTFDEMGLTYVFTGFGGVSGTIVAGPAGSNGQVAQLDKTAAAETWGGVTISTGPMDSVPRFPIDANNTRLTVRVWSPAANTPIRVKIEDSTDAAVSVETEAQTTMANAWETLTFDFANEAMGTAAVDVNATYDKMSVFPNFGTGGGGTASIYYIDDIVWIGGGGTGGGPNPGTFTSATFDEVGVNYAFTGFGGVSGSTVADPVMGASNLVARLEKSATAEVWGGATISTGPMDSVPRFPIDANNTRISVRVWSPTANTPIRIKIEDSTNAAISVETEVQTTMASAWETLTFDFANEAMGTAALDVNATYDKMSVFPNFGTGGGGTATVYYVDDITWVGGGGTGGGPGPGAFNTLDFDTMGVTYSLVGFGGVTGTVVADPTNAANTVGEIDKSATAELWAGATIDIGGGANSVGVIPFAMGMTTMTARVWSPHTGIPVRLKVEDSTDPTRSVETEAMFTAAASSWQTLTFDFSNQAMGTAAINLTYTYDKVSIFMNFGTTGAMAGQRTYYFDDVAFGP